MHCVSCVCECSVVCMHTVHICVPLRYVLHVIAVFEALYDYNGEREGDLQFKIGDKITVTNRSGNWWTGTLNGHSGVFPSNYVQPVRGPSPGLIGSPKAGM